MVPPIQVQDVPGVNVRRVFRLFPLPVRKVQLRRLLHLRLRLLQQRLHLLVNRFALALRIPCVCMRLITQITRSSRLTRAVPLWQQVIKIVSLSPWLFNVWPRRTNVDICWRHATSLWKQMSRRHIWIDNEWEQDANLYLLGWKCESTIHHYGW